MWSGKGSVSDKAYSGPPWPLRNLKEGFTAAEFEGERWAASILQV